MRGGGSVSFGDSPWHPNGRMMDDLARPDWRVALVRVGEHRCALPLDCVVEVMRPQPVTELSDMPAYVRGVSLIRGRPTPVVDLGALLGTPPVDASRLVSLKTGERGVALLVESVEGIAHLSASAITELSGLLTSVEADFTSELAVLDGQLLAVLDGSRLLPEAVWSRLSAREVV